MAESRTTGDRLAAPGAYLDEPSLGRQRTREYFRRLRRRLRIGLVIAFILPLVVLSAYFHYQFNLTLTESDKLHLAALAESQRNTVDLYLQERVVNLFGLFRQAQFSLRPTAEQMERYLEQLRGITPAFVDLGLFDATGVQVAYAGPHPQLRGKDYSRESWFQTLTGQAVEYHITDIYLGFRQKPHVTLAVKQTIDGRPAVLRATLDPEQLYEFLRGIGGEKGVDSAIVNRQGQYQVVDPHRGVVLGPSGFSPPEEQTFGVQETVTDRGREYVAFARLKEVPWVLIVRQPPGAMHAGMYRVRQVMIGSTIALVAVILATIWLTTGRLLLRAQQTEESREQLQFQLMHAAKLASAGELAAGVAHEINNPLAIIAAHSGLMRDMLDPQFHMDPTPDDLRTQLDRIDTAVHRAKTITQQLLSLVRKKEPRCVRCNLNQIMDEVVRTFKQKEFEVSNIRVVRDFDPGLPDVWLDPDQLQQVFLNLINNAGDAIDGAGTITLTTRHDDRAIRATVSDTGRGMTPEQMQHIFLPFYTTKEVGKGTGLGLSISLSIIETMGGRIEVRSAPGVGSSFTVVIPLLTAEEPLDGPRRDG